jgi:hypothetical protein
VVARLPLVEGLGDAAHLGSADAGAALRDAGLVAVGVGEQLHEVDEDVGAAPLPGVHAAEQVDAAARRIAVVDPQGLAGAPLPDTLRQGDPSSERPAP